MNNRRRAIRRAGRLSLYWSTAWRVAESAVQRGEITADGLPPEFDRATLRRAIDALAGGRGTLRELIDDAPESPTRPLGGPPRQDTLKKQI